MDKNQLHTVFSGQLTGSQLQNVFQDLSVLAKQYPYSAPLRFAGFKAKKEISNDDIAQLAIFKGDPYLFACFVKGNSAKPEAPAGIAAVQEDILTLINELPNSNPIENIRVRKAESTANARTETTEPIIPQAEHADFSDEKEDKSLMVMMSFTDWLFHFKNKTEREKQEEKEKKALKTSWQKEKLAMVSEEENEEIPEEIFKQAMDSISENTVISESLAIILGKQGKTDKAVDMYKKLSLRNPEKNLYFADRIKELTTIKDYL
ncbi:MAG: hypothetical protein IT257_05530 [Chitinophagaceae bacterium]|nr:hypothetical protein [Chitinophagaceae bacterium]